MLSCITGKNHPRIPLASQLQQLVHLAASDLAGLIHHDDRTGGQFTLDQKIGNRRWRRESRAFHVHDLLTLRREDNDAPV